MILRRLYLYLVSAAGLGLLAAGAALFGVTILLFVFNDPSADSSRTQLAVFNAMTLVALPVWGVHFWFARRSAMRNPYERASAIRRLYVYWACLGGAIGALIAIAIAAGDLLRPVIDTCGLRGNNQPCPANPNWLATSQAGWLAIVFLAIWAFHFRIASRDRAAVGETGASATLRRWYMYVALLVGLLVMLSGASTLIELAWLKSLNSSLANFRYMGDSAGLLIAGLVVWGFHARTIAQNHVSDDRLSTLRALEGFVVVAVSISVALVGASQILYYGLARALGVPHPGGVGDDLLAALAAPASQLVVYGTAWFFMRRRLAQDAVAQEAERQAGIRRLYTNLVALLVVGAVVWLAHWRQAPWAADRQALPRRLYVWAALLASVLVVLGAGVGMLAAVLRQAFSAHPALADSANLDFGHYLGVILVAAGVGFYHWRVLRADSGARPPSSHTDAEPPPVGAVVAAAVPVLIPTPEVADPNTRRYLLSVTDATEDDVHQALSSLPPHAAYKLVPTDKSAVPVDGH